MATPTQTQTGLHPTTERSRDQVMVRAYSEGIRAGLVGAATIAVWFALIDGLQGRWFHTPTVLGTAVFRGGAGLDHPETLQPSLEMVLSFTWIHLLAFLLIGMAVALLLVQAENNSHFGFGILLLFAIFEFGFVALCMLFAAPVLEALAWPAIVVGNMLAAATMAVTFWRGHRQLRIQP
jgi:hypothetical protein